jgi:ribonuclease HI
VTGGPGERGGGGAAGWLHLYSDGAARGNPGHAGLGGQARDSSGNVLVEVREYLGETTNNVAEYHALIRVLEASEGLGYERLKVHTDSELLANQATGAFKVKSQALRPLVARVRGLLEMYRTVQVEHISREKNTECDRLANLAIDEGLAGLRSPILDGGEQALF